MLHSVFSHLLAARKKPAPLFAAWMFLGVPALQRCIHLFNRRGVCHPFLAGPAGDEVDRKHLSALGTNKRFSRTPRRMDLNCEHLGRFFHDDGCRQSFGGLVARFLVFVEKSLAHDALRYVPRFG